MGCQKFNIISKDSNASKATEKETTACLKGRSFQTPGSHTQLTHAFIQQV